MTSGDTYVKQIWLHILRGGGWWSCSELRDEVDSGYNTARRLTGMAEAGQVERRTKDGVLQYAVTLKCKPPSGVTLKEIADVMGGQVA